MAGGSRRRNGLEVASVKVRKPVLMSPSTPRTRAMNVSGSERLSAATANDQVVSTRIHSINEPSCAPHTAATR